MKGHDGVTGIGLIGCGGMGRVWRDAVARRAADIGDCRLRAAFDTRRDAAEERVAGTDARVADGVDDLLADPGVGAVVICTPTFTHADLGVAAARVGKHVLVEKPMALTLGDCRRMINACSQAGVKLAVGQTLRFWGAFLKARQLVAEGIIGTPWAAQVHRMGAAARRPVPDPDAGPDPGRQRRPWRFDTRTAGGNILEGVVHELDVTRSIFGPVVRARGLASGKLDAAGHRAPILVEAHLEFGDRRTATVRMGGLVGFDGGGSWIAGTEGTLRFDSWDGPVHIHGPGRDDVRAVACDDLGVGEAAGPGTYGRELADWLDAIRDDVEPQNSGRNGMENIGLGLALYASIASGMPVDFADGLPVGIDEDYQYRGPTEVL